MWLIYAAIMIIAIIIKYWYIPVGLIILCVLLSIYSSKTEDNQTSPSSEKAELPNKYPAREQAEAKIFDEHGYDKDGFDRAGFNRAGYNRDGYNKDGYDRYGYDWLGYDREGYNRAGFDGEGYNRDGYDIYGFARDGYTRDGYDRCGYNRDGYDRLGFNREGFNADGYNKEGYDRNGYDKAGYNKNGYDKDGYDKSGYNINGYDKYGYGQNGYNEEGYDRSGYNTDGYDKDGFDRDGYDRDGYDRDGYDRDGYDRGGYDRDGYDRGGYDRDGYDRGGYDRDGHDRDGYNKAGYNRDGYNRVGSDMAGHAEVEIDKVGLVHRENACGETCISPGDQARKLDGDSLGGRQDDNLPTSIKAARVLNIKQRELGTGYIASINPSNNTVQIQFESGIRYYLIDYIGNTIKCKTGDIDTTKLKAQIREYCKTHKITKPDKTPDRFNTSKTGRNGGGYNEPGTRYNSGYVAKPYYQPGKNPVRFYYQGDVSLFSEEWISRRVSVERTKTRGWYLYQSGSVLKLQRSQNGLEYLGIVRGSTGINYSCFFTLSKDGNIEKWHCNCPAFSKYKKACKHLVAMFYAARNDFGG